jgi:hypothetical protein
MVRVEAAHRAVHLGPRAQHRPIEIDRQPGQAAALDLVVYEVPDQVRQPVKGRRCEGLEPAHHRAIHRSAMKTCEPQQDRIDAHEGQVGDAQAADHEQADQ